MNIMQLTGILKTLDPLSVRSIILDDDFILNPTNPSQEYEFSQGFFLYLILRIDDGGSGLGKYVYFKVQRVAEEQILSKPDVAGMPVEMYKWRVWRGRGANPGLLEYDDAEGVYVIEANYYWNAIQIEDPYKITIAYPKKETLVAYSDESALTNYGSDITVEVKIAVKEINYERVYNILKEFYTETVADGFLRAIFSLMRPTEQKVEKVEEVKKERVMKIVEELVKPIPYKPLE